MGRGQRFHELKSPALATKRMHTARTGTGQEVKLLLPFERAFVS